MQNSLSSYTVRKLGSNRGAPRIWLEGSIPAKAGFTPNARFELDLNEQAEKLVIKLNPQGLRVVSKKARGASVEPVIDLNSKTVLSMFAGLEHIRVIARPGEIIIQPLDSDIRAKARMDRIKDKLNLGIPLSIGSLSHGGGILSKAVHDGLKESGIESKLTFANEIREELLEHSERVNPVFTATTIALAAPMQELAFDTEALQKLPVCDLLEAGLPCSGASLSGRAKLGTACAEDHPLVGHLVVAYLAIVARVNPVVCVLENVPSYQKSASMSIIRNQLREFGYEVHEKLVNGGDWGALEHRQRLCMVAVSKGISFDFDDLISNQSIKREKVGDILEDVADDSPMWSTMDYLKIKEERDAANGKGFAMQILTKDAVKVGTIGKGYAKNRSTEPKLQHPVNKDLLRLFTPLEHCAIKQVDPQLIGGLSATVAHEVLGQGIIPTPFKAIAKLIGKSLLDLKEKVLTCLTKPEQDTVKISLLSSSSHKEVKLCHSTIQASLF